MRATVVVITAPGHPTLLESRYLIRYLAEHWQPKGIRFELTSDARVAPNGDLAWLHLDTTDVSAPYRELAARYPFVINGRTRSVQKSRVATHLVSKPQDCNGPVVVKTQMNFGGRADDWGHRWRSRRHPWFHAALNRMPSRLTGRINPDNYPVYESAEAVPGWIWRDSRFVVQQFLSERRDGLYGIRRWFFLGECEFAYRAFGAGPLIAGDDHETWEQLEHLPDQLRAFRRELGLDFGKIDYAEVDGELVIYDVNPAVSADGPAGSPLQGEMVAALIPGLESLLASAGL